MKAIKLFLIAGVSLLALSSCQKAEKLGGQEVRFSASFSPVTKTAYADDAPEYGSGPVGKQTILWTDNDKALVWSDKAVTRYGGESSFQYDMVPIEGGTKATLANPAGTNGLVYVEGEPKYNFWASCPAVSSFENGTAVYSINSQTGGSATDGVIPADMSQAFLLGSAFDVDPQPYGSKEKTIPLVFKPAFTAYEISIKGALDDDEGSIALTSLSLNNLAGTVEATIDTDGINYNVSNVSNLIYTFPQSTEISNNAGITFTVIALPVDANGLKLTFTTGAGEERTATLTNKSDGTPITFEACKKHRLYGLAMTDKIQLFASLEAMEYADYNDIFFE